MNVAELTALIDRLRAEPRETEWLEFKANRFEPQVLGEYLSALANAAGLIGKPESATLLNPAVAKVSWLLKNDRNEDLDYEHFGPPFLLLGDRLMTRIRNLKVRELPGGTLFPMEMTQYDPWATDDKARHIRDKGLDNRYYQEMILELIRTHQPVTREDVDEVLLNKLPEVLSHEQKLAKIHNLMMTLAHRLHKIQNAGTRGEPRWTLTSDPMEQINKENKGKKTKA